VPPPGRLPIPMLRPRRARRTPARLPTRMPATRTEWLRERALASPRRRPAAARRRRRRRGGFAWRGLCLGGTGPGPPGNVTMSRNVPPPRVLAPLADADAWPGHGVGRRWRAVAGDADAAVVAHQVGAVELAGDAEGLRKLAGAVGEVVVAARAWTQGAHRLDAGDRLERADQHADPFVHLAAHGVRAPVHAVGEVDVHVPRLAEHGGVAGGLAAVGVRRGVLGAAAGLALDAAAGAPVVAHQQLVQQFRRDLARVAPVDAAGKGAPARGPAIHGPIIAVPWPRQCRPSRLAR